MSVPKILNYMRALHQAGAINENWEIVSANDPKVRKRVPIIYRVALRYNDNGHQLIVIGYPYGDVPSDAVLTHVDPEAAAVDMMGQQYWMLSGQYLFSDWNIPTSQAEQLRTQSTGLFSWCGAYHRPRKTQTISVDLRSPVITALFDCGFLESQFPTICPADVPKLDPSMPGAALLQNEPAVITQRGTVES